MKITKLAGALLFTLSMLLGCNSDNDENTSDNTDTQVRPPNYITLLVDDMGFSDTGVFGGEISTPNIDSLATDGVLLTNFYSAATSTPSRGMLFTGKDHHQAGVGNMGGWMKDRPEQIGQPGYEGLLSLNALPFPQVLQENGYETMVVGKWDLGETPDYYPNKRGFNQTFVLLPGGDTHYLSDANGKSLTSQPPVYYAGLKLKTPYNENGNEVTTFPPNAYSSTYFTDKAIEMLDKNKADENKPFLLTMCYNAPHAPFQAPAEVTAKYIDTYAKGWDVIRQERFERLKQLGIVAQDATLPPRPDSVPAWNDLSDQEKLTEAKRMAVYAAMVDVVDQNIGRLVDHLIEIGEYDRTVIFFMSDNGGAYMEAGAPAKQKFIAQNFTGLEDYENMGGPHSFISSNEGWGMVMNTPFSGYKGDTYEGGIHTNAFVHYPRSEAAGVISNRLSSIMDIAATTMDMSGIKYPDTFNGQPNSPLQGVSMAPLFKGDVSSGDPKRYLAWELDGAKGVRTGGWALSQRWYDDIQCWDGEWHMYDLNTDPFETNDLAESDPAKLLELTTIYQDYAEENGVIELIDPCPYGPDPRIQ